MATGGRRSWTATIAGFSALLAASVVPLATASDAADLDSAMAPASIALGVLTDIAETPGGDVVGSTAASSTGNAPASINALPPARLWDSRPTGETVDGAATATGRLPAGQVFELQVAGRGGVPSTGVGSAMLNVTVVSPSGPGFATVYPCDVPRPNASNLNYVPGDVVPNLVLASLDPVGQTCVFTLAEADFVVDVNAWVPAEGDLVGLTPARLWDSRPGFDTIDGLATGTGRLGAGEVFEVQITGRGGVPTDEIGTALINVTAVRPSAPGYATVYPCDAPRPNASNLNYVPGDVVPNAVLATPDADGRVCVFTLADADFVIDVSAWSTNATGIVGMSPTRVWDSRPGQQTADGISAGTGALGSGSAFELQLGGRFGIPENGVAAAVLNVVAVTPTGSGFATVYPCDEQRPNASNLNYRPGDIVPNAVLAKLDASGAVCIFTLATSHFVVDVNAWIADDTGIAYTLGDDSIEIDDTDIIAAAPGATDQRALIRLRPDVTAPSVGGHLLISPTPDFPNGMVAEVVSVMPDGTLVVEQVPLEAAYESLLIDFEGAPELEGVGGANRLTKGGSLKLPLDADDWTCSANGVPMSLDDVVETESGIPALHVEFRDVWAKYFFQFERFDWPSLNLAFRVNPYVSLNVAVKLAGAKCELSHSYQRDNRLVWNIQAGKIPLRITLAPSFEIGADLEVTFSLEQQHRIYVSINKLGDRPLRTTNGYGADDAQFNVGVTGGLYAFVGGDLTVGVGGGHGNVGVSAGVQGKFGPRLDLTASATTLKTCVELSGRLEADLGLNLDLWFGRWTPTLTKLSTDPVEIGGPWCLVDPAPRPTPPTTSPGGGGSLPDGVELLHSGDEQWLQVQAVSNEATAILDRHPPSVPQDPSEFIPTILDIETGSLTALGSRRGFARGLSLDGGRALIRPPRNTPALDYVYQLEPAAVVTTVAGGGVVLSGDGKKVLTGNAQGFALLDVGSGDLDALPGMQEPVIDGSTYGHGHLQLSDDGSRIAYLEARCKVVVYTVATNQADVIEEGCPPDPTNPLGFVSTVSAPVLSGDGRSVFYTVQTFTASELITRIYREDLMTSERLLIREIGREVPGSDGSPIATNQSGEFVVIDRSSSLEVVDVQSGTSYLLLEHWQDDGDPDSEPRYVNSAEMSGDGDIVVFVTNGLQGDDYEVYRWVNPL